MGVPLFDALVRVEALHPVAPKLPHEKLDTVGYVYGEDPEFLSHLALNPYRVVTDGQTDRQTDGQNSHS